MKRKMLKRFLALTMIFAMVLLSIPGGFTAFAAVPNPTHTIEIKNSSRTDSMTVSYTYFDNILLENVTVNLPKVEVSSGVPFDIPIDALVSVTLKYKGTTPFPGAVKLRTDAPGGQPIAATNYENTFYFIAGRDFQGLGIIDQVTSWKVEDAGAFNLLSVESFDDKFVEYGTTLEELNLPTVATVTVDDSIVYYPGPTTVENIPIQWDLGNPIYDGTGNALFTGTLDLPDTIANPTEMGVSLMVYVYFYDVIDIESFPVIQDYYGTPFELPTEVDLEVTRWYMDGTKVFTGEDFDITVPINFDEGTPDYGVAPFLITMDSTFVGTPVLPPNTFGEDTTNQDVVLLYYEIDDDVDLGNTMYYPGDAYPNTTSPVSTPIDVGPNQDLDVIWTLVETIDVGDGSFTGSLVHKYEGEFQLVAGLLNSGLYKAFWTTEMPYVEIIDDVNLGTTEYYPGDAYPDEPNPVTTPVSEGPDRDLDVVWTLVDTIDKGDPGFTGSRVHVYEGEFQLVLGLLNSGEYMATWTTEMPYVEIIDDVDLGTTEYYPGDAYPDEPNPVSTPVSEGPNRDLDVVWTMVESIDVGDPGFTGSRVQVYEGEFQLVFGLLNTGQYMANWMTEMPYVEIADDVVLDPIELFINEPDPTLPTIVSTPVTEGPNRDLEVTWTLVETVDEGTGFNKKQVKRYVGEFDIEGIVGLINPNEYQAFIEVQKQYLAVVEVYALPDIEVLEGTAIVDFDPLLADEVEVLLNNGEEVFLDINVDDGTPDYDGTTHSIFEGELVLGDLLNPNELTSSQYVRVTDVFIVSAVDPSPITVPYGASLLNFVPWGADATFTDESLDGYHHVAYDDIIVTGDMTVRGDFDQLPDHVGNPDDVHVNLDVIVQKVIIVEEPEASVQSEGVTLRIGYNRTVAEGEDQLYYTLLPDILGDYEFEWQINSGEGFIDLTEDGFVTGEENGIAEVQVTIYYGGDSAYTDTSENFYQYMIYDTIEVNVIRYYPEPTPPTPRVTPSIFLDREEVELEYGTEALEEFLSYDFTETVVNSNSFAVTWTIDDEEIATVDQNGVVTAVSAGETTVTVRHNASGATDTALVIVFLVGDEPIPLGALEFYDPYVFGYPDTTFRPENNVTRAEVATMFAKILKLNLDFPGSPKYTDVYEEDWFYPYVQAMYRTGIFVGPGDGSFQPNAPISRSEIATVFTKFLVFSKLTTDDTAVTSIKDVSGAHWASKYIYSMYNSGLMVGFPDGTYRPNDFTKRDHVVGMINNLINRPEYLPFFTKYTDITPGYWAFGDIEAATTFFSKQNALQIEEEEE